MNLLLFVIASIIITPFGKSVYLNEGNRTLVVLSIVYGYFPSKE